MTTRRHPDAFMLMTYATESGEREVIWNSRDGVTPFTIASRTGELAMHVEWERDRFAPDHVPEVGDRIFVDLTEQVARIWAAERLEAIESDPELSSDMQEQFASRNEALLSIFESYYKPGAPNLIDVTAGFIEELQSVRRGASEPAVEHPVEPLAEPVSNDDPHDKLSDDPSEGLHFDRQGRPIGFRTWAKLYEGDREYKIVRHDYVRPGFLVSTVWLGTDHRFGGREGLPIIFETMMERDGEWLDYQVRYCTEAEALEGHAAALAYAQGLLDAEPLAARGGKSS